ncbi:sugar phosphate isomerase/epimerase family protein [Penaeicola halotolerans]|uniref:sugar phosphate isomerase/epimerase family protein n=1 Tax=Penaeicola halotolerans TaxID=2793196 RepID=UPI001CF86DFB|nr:sugar phosphate isomerase/epimerase [Penaeicola halotolerans]
MKNRRKFLQQSALLGAAAMLPLQFCSPKQGDESTNTAAKPLLDKFGIQLFTVKEEMLEDPAGTLKALASYGYQQIESCDQGKTIFWGMKHTEFKQVADDLGLEIVSTHADVFANLEAQAEQAAEIGIQYMICPWLGPQASMDDFKRYADEFNRIGKICQSFGIQFGYHNHDYSFLELDGQIPQDYLMENTDPALVTYELDMYWVHVAGKDPISYLEKYGDRFKLSHIKDFDDKIPKTAENASTLLGRGVMDYSQLIQKATATGMKYFMVEQERFDGTSPIEAAQLNASYLKALS